MKLSPFLWGALVVLGALVLYGHWRDTREADAVKVYQHTLDSLNLAIGISDGEAVKLAAEAGRWERIADSLAALPHDVPAPRAPLPSPVIATGTPSDSAAQWKADAMQARASADSLAADNDTLRTTLGTLKGQLAATVHLLALSRVSDSTHLAERDRAIATANRAPVGHKRGLSLLGVRLCPTIGAGYGATLQGGVVRAGPTLAVVQPLSCGA